MKFYGRIEWSLYHSGSIYLLAKTGMVDCKLANTPIQVNYGLRIIEGAHPAEKEKYQWLVGKLIYLAHTRTDTTYVIGFVT